MQMHSRNGFAHGGAVTFAGFASARRTVAKTANAISEFLRHARAYNELSRMDSRILRDIGFRRGELDRILAGQSPRTDRQDP